MSLSLLPKTMESDIGKKLGGKVSILGNAISVAKLYVAMGSEWKDTGIMGALVFCQDRETKCQYVKIFDLGPGLSLRFQAEVSYDPVYVVESEFFHTLELENNLVGFLHSHGTVNPIPLENGSTSTITEARRFASAITRFKQGQDELKEAKHLFQAQAPQQSARRRGSSVVNKFKSALGLGEQKSSASSVVSGPSNFIHVGHVGINPDGTMDVDKCPAEWKQHLKSSGITKKEMANNPELNKQVVKTLTTLIPLDADGKPTQQQPQMQPSTPPAMNAVTVKYDFTASDAKQLSISVGEVVLVNKEYGDGWSKVTRVSDAKIGMVPTNYLDTTTATPASAIPMARPPSAPSGIPPRVPAAAPVAGMPPRPRPASRVPAATPAAAAAAPSAAEEEPEPEREPSPPPKPVNPLLAGIAGFKKEDLAKTEPAAQRPSGNPLLDQIRSGQTLKKTEVVQKTSTPSLLDSIKQGQQLRKVEAPDPSKKPPIPATHVEPSLNNLFSDALAKIRQDVIGDDDDDEESGSDWD